MADRSARPTFYSWLAAPMSQRHWDEEHLIDTAFNLHADDPEVGHRLLTDE